MTIQLRQDKHGVWILPVKVTPKGGRDIVLPVNPEDDALKLKVSAPPDKGEANEAVIALLAKTLGLPKSQVSIVKGETSRQKQVALATSWSPEACRQHLAEAFSAHPDCFETRT